MLAEAASIAPLGRTLPQVRSSARPPTTSSQTLTTGDTATLTWEAFSSSAADVGDPSALGELTVGG